MANLSALTQRKFQPDWRGLLDNILCKGTPSRAYNLDFFYDWNVAIKIVEMFDLLPPGKRSDWHYLTPAVQRFCGQDFVRAPLIDIILPAFKARTEDAAAGELKFENGRWYQDEHRGPIMSWEDFEKYKWPDPLEPARAADLEWYSQNLPDDMCIIGGATGQVMENLSFLMGYETLCLSLFDNRDLVRAIADRLTDYYVKCVRAFLQFDRVKVVCAADDMGFKGGTLISPADLREFVLPVHKKLAAMCHAAGRPYLLHSCGNLRDIYPDLFEDVKIDGKHSFEDTIEDVRDVKKAWGRKAAMLGGMDVDFLCRSDEQAIRARVRRTLDACMPGGGFCLGTGNSVTNYMPVENYLAMLDEGLAYQ